MIGITEQTKLLLLKTKVGTIGCVVDGVGKVFQADGENLQPFPKIARGNGTEYIDFIAKRDNELIVVIDPDGVMTEEEAGEISKLDLSKCMEES
jgi:purine-binding chemotaxis protein CheW